MDSYFTFNTNCTRSRQFSLVCPLSCVKSFRYLFFVDAPYLQNRIPFDVLDCDFYRCFNDGCITVFNCLCIGQSF